MAYAAMIKGSQENNDSTITLTTSYKKVLDANYGTTGDDVGTDGSATTGATYMSNIIIANNETTGTKRVIVSFDGTNNLLSLGPGQSTQFDMLESLTRKVYLKGSSGSEAFMVSGRA